MTADEYFNDHIPHRVCLLTTFRDRYSQNPTRLGFKSGEPRDLFRCSKDISMLMVRFFCGEMGLYLPKKRNGGKAGNDLEEMRTWKSFFKINQFSKMEATADPRYEKLLIVMKAANRAVAHIEDVDVDHPIKTEKDHHILFDTINWIEELIQSHMYGPNNKSLKDAMRLSNNV